MAKHNAENAQIKNDHFKLLKEADIGVCS